MCSAFWMELECIRILNGKDTRFQILFLEPFASNPDVLRNRSLELSYVKNNVYDIPPPYLFWHLGNSVESNRSVQKDGRCLTSLWTIWSLLKSQKKVIDCLPNPWLGRQGWVIIGLLIDEDEVIGVIRISIWMEYEWLSSDAGGSVV